MWPVHKNLEAKNPGATAPLHMLENWLCKTGTKNRSFGFGFYRGANGMQDDILQKWGDTDDRSATRHFCRLYLPKKAGTRITVFLIYFLCHVHYEVPPEWVAV